MFNNLPGQGLGGSPSRLLAFGLGLWGAARIIRFASDAHIFIRSIQVVEFNSLKTIINFIKEKVE